MKTEYILFTRTSKKNRTVLPKPGQSAKEVKFFVRKSIAHMFPKVIDHKAIHMADLIVADGVIIKNVVGATNV